MTSGIYKLTFSSGKVYIGKSENIELRWQQHYASFVKNTHSKKMQREYNQYGNPEYEIVLYVHPDHIDIYESIYIQLYWGPNCLNGNRPKPINAQDAEKYLKYYDTVTINDTGAMMHSSLMHLQAMEQYCKKLYETEHELKCSQHDVLELETRGIKMPKTWKSMNDELNRENHELNNECSRYHRELKRLQRLSWWDRLWNYRVNV